LRQIGGLSISIGNGGDITGQSQAPLDLRQAAEGMKE